MRETRFTVIIIVLAFAGWSMPVRSAPYQSYQTKAKKFGAKDCLFCHVYEYGGMGWNERGQWLIDQKEKRKAEKIDVAWLAEYKPEETEQAKEPQSETKTKSSTGEKPGSEKPHKP